MVLNQKMESVLTKTFRRPTRDKPRELAFEIFRDVIRNNQYSNLILPKRLMESGLDSRDKSFVTELVYGSIRQIGRNDYIASKYSSRTWSEVDEGIVDLIRLGAYQLFDMRVPTHAAVDTTVNLARKILGESKASFINAMMRKFSSRPLEEHLEDVSDDSVSSLSIRYSHPEWIINSYRDFISDAEELKSLLVANNTPVPPTLVAWPGLSSQEELISHGAVATKFSRYGAVYQGAPGDLEAIKERRAGVQDEGSQILVSVFEQAAINNEPWLDLCAGPGGKAALLSYLAKERFFANEVSIARTELVKKVIKPGSKVINADGCVLDSSWLENTQIGAVLADVPCTGLGALRRRPEIRWRRQISDLQSLTTLQYRLAENAIKILPNGGIFGYATCSPHMAETSAQCATFEKHFPIDKINVEPFMPEGLDGGVRNGFMQLWPHRHSTDAMFLALYRKR